MWAWKHSEKAYSPRSSRNSPPTPPGKWPSSSTPAPMSTPMSTMCRCTRNLKRANMLRYSRLSIVYLFITLVLSIGSATGQKAAGSTSGGNGTGESSSKKQKKNGKVFFLMSSFMYFVSKVQNTLFQELIGIIRKKVLIIRRLPASPYSVRSISTNRVQAGLVSTSLLKKARLKRSLIKVMAWYVQK